jgi:hypothetical protein
LATLPPLVLIAVASGEAQPFDVVTLVSPHEVEGGLFGSVVAGAGDVDSDGIPDVIVGEPMNDEQFQTGEGRAYVFSGADGDLLLELVSPNAQYSGQFGVRVAAAGDVDQDGFGDLVVGAPGEDPGASPILAGRAYLFSGRDGSVLLELASPHEEKWGLFGSSVAGVGDLDRDGVPDVAVGAMDSPGTSPSGSGRVYVVSGRDGALLLELSSPNEEEGGAFSGVSGAGDVDGDGLPDLIVSARGEDPGDSPENAGRVYVFSGQGGALLHTLVSPNEQAYALWGKAVGAGDVDQDGFDDVMIGAPDEDSDTGLENVGRAYVFSGQDGSLVFQLASPHEQYRGAFGQVSGAGDVDGDGAPDLIVGAGGEFVGSGGRAYVFSGKDASLLHELVPPPGEGGGFGGAVAALGDVNSDAHADLVVGAPIASPDTGPVSAGRAYLFVSGGARVGVNSGGLAYTDAGGRLFLADQPYAAGSFGYVGGRRLRFNHAIEGTADDRLYQDLRLTREGYFSYRFDLAKAATYNVTLHLMAPRLAGVGAVVMDVQAEGQTFLDDLDVTAEAGGVYHALVKTLAVGVSDGRLDIRFRAVNGAALVCAIAVEEQSP